VLGEPSGVHCSGFVVVCMDDVNLHHHMNATHTPKSNNIVKNKSHEKRGFG